MPNAESSNFKLFINKTESTATPTATGEYYAYRPTSVGLTPNVESTQSAEIRAGRTPPDQIRTNATGQGDVNSELSAKTHDDIFECAMNNAWVDKTADVPAGVDNAQISAAGVIAEGTGSPFTNTNVGDILIIGSGSTGGTPAWDAANNGAVIVTAKTGAQQITVSKINGDDFIPCGQTSGSTIEFVGETTPYFEIPSPAGEAHYLWIEKQFDLDPGNDDFVFEFYKRARVATLDLSMTPGAISTLNWTVQAVFPDIASGTIALAQHRPGNQTNDRDLGNGVGAPYETKPMNGLDDVTAIVEGDTNQLIDNVTELTMTINNNLANDSALGAFGSVQTRLGAANVTGRISLFLADDTLIAKMLAETATTLAWVVQDDAENAIGFRATGVRFTNAQTPVGGAGDLVTQQLDWNATGLVITRIASA